MRAWKYEEKLDEGKGGELARACWEEIKGKSRKGIALKGWEGKRKEYFEEREWKLEEIENMREAGLSRSKKTYRKEKEMQREKIWGKIKKAKFNRWYGMVWLKGKGYQGI